MQWYHYVLAATAIATLISAWHIPRAKLWLGLGVWSYVTSALFHNLGAPYATLYGGSTDIVTCILLFSLARAKWEMGVFSGFIFMILVDLLHAGGSIRTDFAYAFTLEIANMCVMLLMIATGISNKLGKNGRGRLHNAWRPDHLFPRLHYALHKDRAKYPRWWREP